MTDALYVIAKAPRPGFAKTRLGRCIGDARAAMLYCAFLRDLAARFQDAPWQPRWYVTPSDAWAEIHRLVLREVSDPTVLIQPDGDLRERQRWLLEGAVARQEDRIVLIASDSPQIEQSTIADAFDALETHDIVFGPTLDGGYYLIGMRGWHDVLQDVPMGTSSVLDDLLDCADALGCSAALVEPLFDVDTDDDLNLLRDLSRVRRDLGHTRRALEAIERAAAPPPGIESVDLRLILPPGVVPTV